MRATLHGEDSVFDGEGLISTGYYFHGVSVEVRARNRPLLDALNSIYSHFTAGTGDGADPDLIIDIIDGNRYLFASIAAGLNSYALDEWNIASFIQRTPEGRRLYRIKGGPGFYEFLKNTYYAILSLVLSNLGGFLQFHAGAVARGRTGIVFPGGSGRGKTTLTLALIGAGYRFLSDEICLVDPLSLSARSFPRSIFLREDGVGLFGDLNVGRYLGDIFVMREKKCLFEIEKKSIQPGGVDVRVCFIIFPNYTPGARAALQEVSPVEALARLISSGSVLNMSHLGADQGGAIDSISALVASIPCFELTTPNINDAVRLIDDLVR